MIHITKISSFCSTLQVNYYEPISQTTGALAVYSHTQLPDQWEGDYEKISLETGANQFYYLLKIFRRFWLAQIFRLILHKKKNASNVYVPSIGHFQDGVILRLLSTRILLGFAFWCKKEKTKWILVLIVKRSKSSYKGPIRQAHW